MVHHLIYGGERVLWDTELGQFSCPEFPNWATGLNQICQEAQKSGEYHNNPVRPVYVKVTDPAKTPAEFIAMMLIDGHDYRDYMKLPPELSWDMGVPLLIPYKVSADDHELIH